MKIVRALVLVLMLVLVACGGDTSETTPVVTEAGAQPESEGATAETSPATTAVPENTASADPSDETAPSSETITFGFVEGSEVRFIIDEELRGSPKTVVGVNTMLSGTFTTGETGSRLVEPATVVIRADAFVTDSDRRDGAIDRFILDTGAHPEITFTFEEIDGEGMIAGTLTIRDVSHPVTFSTGGTATPDRIEINGSAVVSHADWGLSIPSVPFVANVSEDVTLEFDFVLEPVG